MMRASIGVSSPACPLGIAGAIPVLVMQLNRRKVRREALHAFKNPSPNHRMLLDECEFFFGQAAWLLQNAVGDTDLSHVVQQARQCESAPLRADRVASRLRWRRIAGSRGCCVLRCKVARVKRVRQRADKLKVGRFKIFAGRTNRNRRTIVDLRQLLNFTNRGSLPFQFRQLARTPLHCEDAPQPPPAA